MQTKFICGANAFAKALSQIASIVPTKPLLPSLENVLMQCQGSVVGQAASLRLICSNMKTTLSVKLPIDSTENFQALLPAKKLLETLRSFPDQPITFTLDEAAFTLELKAERSKYKLTGENPADFPKVPSLKRDHSAIPLPANILRAGLLSALTTARKDNLGAEFENVLIEVQAAGEGMIDGYVVNIVGADNPNISVFTYHGDGTLNSELPTSLMLSRGPAQYLASVLSEKDESEVVLLADSVNVRLKDGRWASRLAEGTYPAYQRVMPVASENTLLVDSQELLSAVKRLGKYGDELRSTITLHLDALDTTTAYLTAENTGFEQSGTEELLVEYDGGSLEISFNAEQLGNLLALYPKGQVELGMGDETRAVLITEAVDAHDFSPLTCLLVPLHKLIAA